MNTPLLSWAHSPPPDWLQDATVSDMWDRDMGWKLELFADYLPKQQVRGCYLMNSLMMIKPMTSFIGMDPDPFGELYQCSVVKIVCKEE